MKKRRQTKNQKKYERLKRKQRYGPRWDDIRKLVYKRDGERCRACGRHRTEVHKLNAHHIILLRVSQTNDARNLITLCDECHVELEQKGLKLLKSGGHRKDIVRMTYRYLIEKKKSMKDKLNETTE
jgi:5-methylcytosine-specific restriction endonuclease McrA